MKTHQRVVARRDKNYKVVHKTHPRGHSIPCIQNTVETQSLQLYEAWLDEKLKEDPDFLDPLLCYNLGCFWSWADS